MKYEESKMIRNCISWLEEALYNIQSGKIGFGETHITEVIKALKALEG